MKTIFMPVLCAVVLVGLSVFHAAPAHAACASPAGDAGDVIWSSASNAPAYCNDTDWVGFPKTGAALSWASPNLLSTMQHTAPLAGDYFGYATAVSGDRVLIGAYLDDLGPGQDDAGSAHVYDAYTGNLVATLVSPDSSNDDYFGNVVGISGDLALVGAYAEDAGGINNAGRAYVYNASTGALTTTLSNPSPDVDDTFATAAAISGNLAVVGAPGDDPGGVSAAGTAYVFNALTGALVSTLNKPAPAVDDFFGRSVAISGQLAVVGAPGDDPGGIGEAGSAYVFNATTGALVSTLNNPNPNGGDSFGSSVSISGDLVAVGAYMDDPGGVFSAGSAYVFNASTGALVATLGNPTGVASGYFGYSVSISRDLVLVGAHGDNSSGFTEGGAAYLFDATTGTHVATLSNPTPSVEDHFARSVSLAGDLAVVGAYQEDPSSVWEAGVVHVFRPTAAAGPCVNPTGSQGDVAYNSASHVLQYCDGAAWHGAGPVGNGGGGCADPVGDAGDIVYNSTHNYLQYCEGDDWIGIGRKDVSAIPPTGCPVIGNTCSDGSIYAGLTPDGSVPMYAAASNAPTQMNWNNGSANDIDTAIVNCTSGVQSGCDTGEANTILLAGLVNAASPYEAATYCSNLVAHGRSDWYLPALNELQLLYTNLYLGGFGGLTNHDYWSSSEQSDDSGKNIYFGDGNTYNGGKSNDFRVRCVRK